MSSGLNQPYDVAVDAAGNVYIADTYNNAIKEWTLATSNVTTLVSGLYLPYGVGVDGSGNVYIADTGNWAIKKWSPANSNLTVFLTGPATGVEVDGAGNIYFDNSEDCVLYELPYAFVDATPKTEPPAAGSDALPVVLPATENLLAPFAPTSDQTWLTITGVTNGVVSFTFTANTSASNRTANITLLGQIISVTQAAPPTLIGATMLGNGVFQFAFTNNNQSATFTVLSTTNLFLPVTNWSVVGTATNIAPNLFQFTDTQASNLQCFYTVRSP